MRLLAMVVLALSTVTSAAVAQETIQLQNPPGGSQGTDPASYGIGYDIGMNIAGGGISAADIKQADLLAGILDGLLGKSPAVKAETIREAMQALGKRVLARKQEVANKYLEENKKKDGVQATESGLQYQVLKSGSGASPNAESTVTVHYEGKLINGEIFDSSIKRGQPASFGVSQVIKGWTEALLRMRVGDKWRLFIPPNLAYGERGSPPAIGPNEALIFEVELLKVN